MEEKAGVPGQVDRLDFVCSVINWLPPVSREDGMRAFSRQRPVWKMRGMFETHHFADPNLEQVLVGSRTRTVP